MRAFLHSRGLHRNPSAACQRERNESTDRRRHLASLERRLSRQHPCAGRAIDRWRCSARCRTRGREPEFLRFLVRATFRSLRLVSRRFRTLPWPTVGASTESTAKRTDSDAYSLSLTVATAPATREEDAAVRHFVSTNTRSESATCERLGALLATGTFGVVYRDRDRPEAVVVRRVYGHDAVLFYRSLQIAIECGRLGIGPVVHEAWMTRDERPGSCTVMAVAHGCTRQQHVVDRGRPFTRELYAAVLDTARRLDGAGVLHRDLHTRNVMVGEADDHKAPVAATTSATASQQTATRAFATPTVTFIDYDLAVRDADCRPPAPSDNEACVVEMWDEYQRLSASNADSRTTDAYRNGTHWGDKIGLT